MTTSWRNKAILLLLMTLLLTAIFPTAAWAEEEKDKDDGSLWEDIKGLFVSDKSEEEKEKENASDESVSGNLGDHFINGIIPEPPDKVGRVETDYSRPISQYQLDLYVEDTYFFEMMDKAYNEGAMTIHGFTNGLWTIALLIAKAVAWIRHEALTIDLVQRMNEDFADAMQRMAGFDGVTLQQAGTVGLLLPFMILCAGLWAGYKSFIEDDDESVKRGLITSGMVILLLFTFIGFGPQLMTKVNDFTMTLRNVVMAVPANMADPNLEEPYTVKEAVAQSNNNVWKVLVDNDFRMMTWGTLDVPEERVNDLLNHSQSSDARKEAVINEGKPEDEGGYGNVNVTIYNIFYRMLFILFWVIPKNLVLGAIHGILSAAILLFQLMFMIFYWLGAVAIVWAVVPSQREALHDWAAETLGAAIMGFAIGVFMAVFNTANDVMYKITAEHGYLAVIGGQLLVIALIIWKREKIMDWSTGMIMKTLGNTSSPEMMSKMWNTGMKYMDPGYYRNRRRRKQRDKFYRNADPGPKKGKGQEERPELLEAEEVEPKSSTTFEFDPPPNLNEPNATGAREAAATLDENETPSSKQSEPALIGGQGREQTSHPVESTQDDGFTKREQPRLLLNDGSSNGNKPTEASEGKKGMGRPNLETATPLEPQVSPKRPSLEVDDD